MAACLEPCSQSPLVLLLPAVELTRGRGWPKKQMAFLIASEQQKTEIMSSRPKELDSWGTLWVGTSRIRQALHCIIPPGRDRDHWSWSLQDAKPHCQIL